MRVVICEENKYKKKKTQANKKSMRLHYKVLKIVNQEKTENPYDFFVVFHHQHPVPGFLGEASELKKP